MSQLLPFGKVSIKILAARDTLVCDITTSDPYCIVTTKDSSDNSLSPNYRTEVIYKTLNPVWNNEEFIFDVVGNSQIISILMYDEDKFSKDDFMGLVNINIDEYKTKGQKDIWIPLEGKKKKESSKKNPNKKPKKRGDIRIQINFNSFSSLSNYLIKENHNIISKLSRQLITDDFGKAIMYYFSNFGNLIETIRDITAVEIEQTSDANVLFRTDSLATKIIVSTLKTIGAEYLKEALSPLIQSMIDNDIKLEVDPSKGVSDAEAESNLVQLSHYCSSFITAIKASIDQLPLEIKSISNIIYQLVELKFPNDNTSIKSVGGFFFLRFVNPAIFSPEVLGLITDAPNKNVRRVLTLISKILQNISNQVVFTSKEKYLEGFNPFISQRFSDFNLILQDVSNASLGDSDGYPLQFSNLKIDSLTLMKHTDTIITSIVDKKQTLTVTNNDEFITEILNRNQLIISQQKQESKKLIEKSK